MFKFLKDEKGQGAAEYMLLIGGALGVVLVFLYVYVSYTNTIKTGLNAEKDINEVRNRPLKWIQP